MRNLVAFILFFSFFYTSAQSQFTSIEAKFNPSIVFDYFKGKEKKPQDISNIRGISNEIGLFVKHNYSPHVSVSTGINGLKQRFDITRINIDTLGMEMGEFYEKQIYEMLSIPLVFSYNFELYKEVVVFISISSDHSIVMKYIDKYSSLPEPSLLGLKNQVMSAFDELKDAGSTLYNIDIGFSVGIQQKFSKSFYYILEPNIKLSLKKLKELDALSDLKTNRYGLRFGVGYQF